MARYIDADNFCGWLETVLEDFGEPNISIRPVAYGSQNALKSVLEVVKKQPAADVVEVVRCKECKHYVELGNEYFYSGKKAMYCCIHSQARYATDFCNHGERRDT